MVTSRKPKDTQTPDLTQLIVNVGSDDETLDFDVDEWYQLSSKCLLYLKSNEVSQYLAQIEARTIYGAMRALETFAQLTRFSFDANKYEISGIPWEIIGK